VGEAQRDVRQDPAAEVALLKHSVALTGGWLACVVAVVLGGVLPFSVSALNDWM
jgi:hypothetical protein